MLNKQLFIDYGFLDNEYLEKYVILINENSSFERIKFKTQKHHAIPVAYYKNKYNLTTRSDAIIKADADLNNCTVNLLYKDHVLAHYYLALCTEGVLRYQNENAIFHVLGNINYLKDKNYKEEFNFLTSLEKYQYLYEDMAKKRSERYTGRHCKPNTLKHKQQISVKNSGAVYVRKYIDDQWVSKKVHSDLEFNTAIAEGWERGNIPRVSCSCDVGKAISNSKKGKICINNGLSNKYIDEKDLIVYLNEGWIKGPRKIGTRARMIIYKLDMQRSIYVDQLDDYKRKGWKTLNENK